MTDFISGESLADTSPATKPDGRSIVGKVVRLDRLDVERDSLPLFEGTHEGAVDAGQWTYMAYGPFQNAEEMHVWMVEAEKSVDPLVMVVHDIEKAVPVGMASYLSISTEHRTLELGNIWYTPAVRRTSINTETIYLMLRESFDELGYRRVEWKCDSLNKRSIDAALRLGFSFEGIFRQHYVVKGRNRDTAWFAMVDSDWPAIKNNFETVLYDPGRRSSSLSSLNLQHVRSCPLLLTDL